VSDPIDLNSKRKTMHQVALVHMDDPAHLPAGPFTVTISDKNGKLYEAIFPDASGDLPASAMVMGTVGVTELMVNLLTGMLRITSGRPA